MIHEPWYKFFPRVIWQRATSNPDLIWIAPMIIGMGFIAPWLFRLLAAVIGPVMWCWGGVLLVVAIGQKVRRIIRRRFC